MLEVLERLCQENCWEIADRYVAALKVPTSWRKKYQARLNAYVTSQMETLRGLVEARRYAEVEGVAMKLLPLTPVKAPIQLLLAKANIGLNNLTEAQLLLKGISHQPERPAIQRHARGVAQPHQPPARRSGYVIRVACGDGQFAPDKRRNLVGHIRYRYHQRSRREESTCYAG
jgi:hypothetical protein